MSNKYLKNNIIEHNNIEIKLNSSNIYYENKNVGENKKIKYNELSKPHLFSIVGEMDKYYKLDTESIPSIEGNINKRDVNIVFNIISKTFDGTNSTLGLYNKFKHNKGYYFTDVDMNNIGNFVDQLTEVIYNADRLESSGNILKNSYKLKYNISDKNDIKVIIDDYIGYVLIDESNNTGEVIFNDDLLDQYKFIINIKDNELNLVNHDLLNKYMIKKELIVYYHTETGNTNVEHIDGDLDEGKFIINDAIFKDVNASDKLIPISIYGELTNNWKENYNINQIIAYGNIKKRPIDISFHIKDKIYDGTNSCEIDGFPAINNAIITYYPTLNYNTKAFCFESSDVGNHKIKSNALNLYLMDNANNYYINEIYYSLNGNILKRKINITFTRLLYDRNKKSLKLFYEFDDDIKSDNLTISPEFTITDSYYENIFDKYFNYKNDYKLSDEELNLKVNTHDNTYDVATDKESNYDINYNIGYTNVNKNIINSDDNKNPNYSNDKLITITNGSDQLYTFKPYNIVTGKSNYYEYRIKVRQNIFSLGLDVSSEEIGFSSANNKHHLKNGDYVFIRNIKLNPDNNKSKNYTLLNDDNNMDHKIKLEVI